MKEKPFYAIVTAGKVNYCTIEKTGTGIRVVVLKTLYAAK